jgi:hypothetical protein
MLTHWTVVDHCDTLSNSLLLTATKSNITEIRPLVKHHGNQIDQIGYCGWIAEPIGMSSFAAWIVLTQARRPR